MRRTKAIGPRFTSLIVVPSIYVKLSKFHESNGDHPVRRTGFHFASINPRQGSIYFSAEVIPGPFRCDPRRRSRCLSVLFIPSPPFFSFNVTGFRVTSSSSQFSSRDSAQFSDSGSADEVDEFEIQGKK